MFDFSSLHIIVTAFIPQNVHLKLIHTLSAAFHLLVPILPDAFVFIHLQLAMQQSLFNHVSLGLQGRSQDTFAP